MSQQIDNNSSDYKDADKIIDDLLAQKVCPSKDFTARVLEEARESKVVQGPWQSRTNWFGGILTAAAAIAIALGLGVLYTPQSGVSELSQETNLDANPFLLDYQDPELVDETPINTIESLLDEPVGLPGLNPLLEEPLSIDIDILLES